MAKLKTKSWLQMTEVVVEEIAEKIPVVGEFVSFVLELFWPEKSEEQNIWEAVKDQTTELIDSKVRERAYNDRSDAIRDVHEKMSDFTNAIAGS
ncbi:MAG: insecticidal delta-endotoxin Cry8Ea1 family protein, partial [Bacteroidota bacterium]